VTLRDDIQGFLDRLGQAISTGDIQAVARCWEVPALVLSDQGAMAIAAVEEIERFFAQAAEYYRGQGLVATRPEIDRVEALGERLCSVNVRWPAFDASGREQTSEHSQYLMRLDDDGQPRIRVAVTLSAPPS
jgi:hypothetical protein